VEIWGNHVAGLERISSEPPKKLTLVLRNDRVDLEAAGWRLDGYHKPASDIQFVSVEDGGTKANVGALVMFGVLGLGARRSWTMVTVGFPDGDVVIAIREPVQAIRADMNSATRECPSLIGKILDGPPAPHVRISPPPNNTPDATQAANSSVDALDKLAGLYERGLIDADEFTALKAPLVDASGPKPTDDREPRPEPAYGGRWDEAPLNDEAEAMIRKRHPGNIGKQMKFRRRIWREIGKPSPTE
jgi:hypothetical protein